MKVARTNLLVAAVLLFAAAANAQAPPTADNCRQFVQKFYDWYTQRSVQNNQELPPEQYALAKRPESFSPELTKALKEDYEASKANADEIVGIDFDPFLNAQDRATFYRAQPATFDGKQCLVPVIGTTPIQKRDIDGPDVRARVEFQKDHWVFTNFLYDKDMTLLQVLADLAKDRQTSADKK